MTKLLITAAVSFLAFGLATRSLAEPGPIGRWLMDQPVSLWDQGLSRMQERAKDATASMSQNMKISAFAVLRYDWDNNEIGINVFVVDNFNPGTHENCNKHRRSFIQGLMGVPPEHLNQQTAETIFPVQVDLWFSHFGYKKNSRDEKLAEKLSRIIFVQVRLTAKDRIVICRDRILSFDAPSKPAASN